MNQIGIDSYHVVTTFLVVFDLTGTFTFALSGAIAAVKHRFDAFGVLVLCFVTGNAGGITRDIMIGASSNPIHDLASLQLESTFYAERNADGTRSLLEVQPWLALCVAMCIGSHFLRIDCSGSARLALNAGIKPARHASSASASVEATKVRGSCGPSPNSWPRQGAECKSKRNAHDETC
jgi:Glycine transporter